MSQASVNPFAILFQKTPDKNENSLDRTIEASSNKLNNLLEKIFLVTLDKGNLMLEYKRK